MSTIACKRCVSAAVAILLFTIAGQSVAGDSTNAQASSGSSTAVAPSSPATLNRDMQMMRAQMLQWHTSRDPAQRAKLLDAHMRTMQSTMQMMMGQGGMRSAGGMGPGMMHGGMSGASGMMPNQHMMQMMLEQMLQHQQAMQAMGCGQ